MKKLIGVSILAFSLLSSVAISAQSVLMEPNLSAQSWSVSAPQLVKAWGVIEFLAMVSGQSLSVSGNPLASAMEVENLEALLVDHVKVNFPKIVNGKPVEKSAAILYFKHELKSSEAQQLLKQAVICYNNLHKMPLELKLLPNNKFSVIEHKKVIVTGFFDSRTMSVEGEAGMETAG